MAEVDLNFLAAQLERLIANDARRQDDMNVLTAMVIRLDHTNGDVLNEIRAVHRTLERVGNRLNTVELRLAELGVRISALETA